MTSPVPAPGNELAVIRLLRETAVTGCPHTRMAPGRRRELRDALMHESRRRAGERWLTVVPNPARRHERRVLEPASA